MHGEADLITSYAPESVLDAGCGTGRVAIELARRGVEVVGVDLDAAMLETARDKAPDLRWELGDLLDVTVVDASSEGRRLFDVVALPGNVMILLSPGTEAAVVANLAAHLRPGGRLIAGFQLGAQRLSLADYAAAAAAAGLQLEDRWSTWDRAPHDDGDYAVSVHRAVSAHRTV